MKAKTPSIEEDTVQHSEARIVVLLHYLRYSDGYILQFYLRYLFQTMLMSICFQQGSSMVTVENVKEKNVPSFQKYIGK